MPPDRSIGPGGPRPTGPGPGAGWDRDPWRAAALGARIAIVATVVLGQLWGLTVALDAWLRGEPGQVWWLLGFQALSFLVALGVWLTTPRGLR
ncbi:MAG TPA: hypothetical protein VNP94_13105 [Actinomycetota bacterium]|nr:hypothetical protein [Actinomycetota bacterium]